MSIKSLKSLFAASALALAASHAGAAPVYASNFPVSSFGGPCSPCGTNWRVYDRLNFANAQSLGRIEFAVHDITAGAIQNVNITVLDGALNTLFSMNFGGAALQKFAYIDGDNYTIGIDLPNWTVGSGQHWVSMFGIGGSQFGLYEGGGGDGYAFQTSNTNALDLNNGLQRRDVAMRLFAAEVPEPSSLALIGLGLAGLGVARRRSAR